MGDQDTSPTSPRERPKEKEKTDTNAKDICFACKRSLILPCIPSEPESEQIFSLSRSSVHIYQSREYVFHRDCYMQAPISELIGAAENPSASGAMRGQASGAMRGQASGAMHGQTSGGFYGQASGGLYGHASGGLFGHASGAMYGQASGALGVRPVYSYDLENEAFEGEVEEGLQEGSDSTESKMNE